MELWKAAGARVGNKLILVVLEPKTHYFSLVSSDVFSSDVFST